MAPVWHFILCFKKETRKGNDPQGACTATFPSPLSFTDFFTSLTPERMEAAAWAQRQGEIGKTGQAGGYSLNNLNNWKKMDHLLWHKTKMPVELR